MKKYVLLATIIIALTGSTAAIAADTASPDTAKMNAPVPPSPGKVNPEMFKMHKAEIVKRMDTAIAEMQKQQKCIEAATTPEDFQACKGGMMGMGMYGMGMGMPPGPPPGMHPPVPPPGGPAEQKAPPPATK